MSASLPPALDSPASLLNLDLRVFVAGKPVYLVLVEKDKQRLRVLQHDGKLKIIAEYKAVTGENEGPKEIEGDAKTPEGIYFITKIYTDSKVTIFGKRAFHLNYPNVFDQEEKKGGNGIFVHGTNKELISNSTNGCITLNNTDLENLVQFLPLETIPVVVVASLDNLSLQNFTDNRIGSFSFNDFERPKAIMLPPELDWRQVFFESLYMVQAGNQTAAVGEYRSFMSPDGTDGGFVRSYIDYDDQNGWIERQSFRQAKRENLDPLLQAQADLFAQTKMARKKGEGELEQFWQNRDDIYLGWYKQSFAGEERGSAKGEAQVTTVEKDGPGKRDFFWLFLISVCVSVGSVWVLIQIRAKQEESASAAEDNQGLELDHALAVRMNNDIAWIRDTLAELRVHTHENITHRENAQKLQETLQELERELEGKQLELEHAMKEQEAFRIQGEENANQQEKEREAANKNLADTRNKLQLTLERAEGLENELQEMTLDIARLNEENRDMQESAEQAVEREAFTEIQAKLDQVQADLREAHLGRQKLEKQMGNLMEVERKFQNHKAENDNLIAENEQLKKIAAQQREDKEALNKIQIEYGAVAAELQEETSRRLELEGQISKLAQDEKETKAHNVEYATELSLVRDQLVLAETKFRELLSGRQELEKQFEKLPEVERELQDHRAENDNLISENEQLKKIAAQQQEDREALNKLQIEYGAAAAELQEETRHRLELEERVAGLVLVDDQLKSSQRERDTLVAENAKLREIAAQAEYKEKLDMLQKHLDVVELEQQEAARHRARLEEQVDHLAEVEKSVIEQQKEIARLAGENMKLQGQVDSKEPGEDETLVEAQRVDDQRAEATQQEKRTKAVTFILPHGEEYLPNDVLKKWIGR